MDLVEARSQVLNSFDSVNFCYSNEIPFRHNDFIDGMAWVGLLCGAAYRRGDQELIAKCEGYLQRLLNVGPDARNYAPTQVSSDWIPSTSMPGFFYKQKAQAFAGPAGLQFAINSGSGLQSPFSPKLKAKLITSTGWLYGHLAKSIQWFRTYIDSYWLSYLILDKKPAGSMEWMMEENPFFAFIGHKKCQVEYPPTARFTQGVQSLEDDVVPLKQAEPSAWIFRRDPFLKYYDQGTGEVENRNYTPIWIVVGEYLQACLP